MTDDKPVMSTLKVRREDQQLVAKVSGLMVVSIAELFATDPVRAFFRGLLAEELKKATRELEATK